MSTTTEGIPEQSDWARPAGCHCFTWRQHEACYENCDPVEPKKSMPKKYWLILIVCVILPLLALIGMIVLAMLSTKARAADLDPYACFGAGRYAAMEQDLQCPKRAAWRLPNYCDGFKLLERSCTSVKAVARVYGRTGAERRARICGATDSDIAQANACFEEKK